MTNDAPAQASVEAMARVIYESTEEILRPNFWEGWSLLDFAKADARTRNVHHVMARAVLSTLSPPPTVGAEDEAPIAWMWTHEDGTRAFTSDPDTKRIWEGTMKRVLVPVYTRPSPSAVEVKEVETLARALFALEEAREELRHYEADLSGEDYNCVELNDTITALRSCIASEKGVSNGG